MVVFFFSRDCCDDAVVLVVVVDSSLCVWRWVSERLNSLPLSEWLARQIFIIQYAFPQIGSFSDSN